MLPILQHPASVEGNGNRLSSLFDRFFRDDAFTPMTGSVVVPLCMWEDEHRLAIEVDVPGLKEDEIDVSVHQGVLSIRGERKFERKNNGYDSRSYGRFEQRIGLPHWAKADSVEAKLESGVLTLSFPKGEEAKPKKITFRNS